MPGPGDIGGIPASSAGPLSLVTFYARVHHDDMVRGTVKLGILFSVLVLSSAAAAGIVDDVREAIALNNLPAAQAELTAYKAQHGADSEYLEGLSWLGRAALSAQQYEQALTYAKQTLALASDALKTQKLDSDEHLPTALGAAYEVEAQALAATGRKPQAVALLRTALQKYGETSVRARIQKNLNMLMFVGQSAPLLKEDEWVGAKPPALAAMKGSPVLLFFWAHWCVDCKGEAPILARLRTEYEMKGLKFMAPTKRYGYAAGGEDAKPAQENAYIESVWQHYYAPLQGVPVPMNKSNFDVYGASTTPTLVLVDKAGKIAFYHPGALPYDELRGAIEKVMN
jgi:thiol-disulfide isomerase/thioredoxin